MGAGAKLGLAGLVATTLVCYLVVSRAYGGDKQAMLEGFHVLALRLGPSAMPVFVAVHTVAIALCFPYAIVFEAAASFLFGFVRGVLCVFTAKVMGAALAFWIGRAVFRSSDWASNAVKKNKYFSVLTKGVARDGWKFVLLARFSPVPSYIINYGLAATDVAFFVDFLLPTLVGGLPMIIQNTSIGSLTSAATHLGGAAGAATADGATADAAADGVSMLPYVLPALGILSSVMITWRIRKYATVGELGSGDDSKEKAAEKEQDWGRPASDDSLVYANATGLQKRTAKHLQE